MDIEGEKGFFTWGNVEIDNVCRELRRIEFVCSTHHGGTVTHTQPLYHEALSARKQISQAIKALDKAMERGKEIVGRV